MDPLSITATVISFIEVAKRIKDSIDKIGQNRETLRQLMSDVVDELTEFQKLCQRQEGDHHRSYFDDDSTNSLESLNSELNNVLERCLQIVGPPRKRNHLSSMSYYIRAWIRSTEIEADIIRLRERVSSVHRRFTYISSMRIENSLLVVSTENQIRMSQMEGLISRLLITSHAVGAYPASLLDKASPGGIEFEYLRLQVQKIVNNPYRISATTNQSLDVIHDDPPVVGSIYLPPPSEPPGSLLRSSTIEALRMQQLLESEPSRLWAPEGVMQLSSLAFDLDHLYLKEDSVAIAHWMVTIYQTLMRQNPIYMPYLAWGLRCLSSFRFGSSEGLYSAESAALIYGELDATFSRDYSLFVALSRRVLAWHQYISSDYDNAVESARQALAMQRNIPDQYSDGDTLIAWEASGEDDLVLTSAQSVVRSYLMAVVEGLCLNIYALSLAAVGRYSDASIVGSEAISCFTALSRYRHDALLSRILLERLESQPKWASITYQPAHPPAFASISNVEDSDSVEEEEVGEVQAPLHQTGSPVLVRA